MKRTNNSGAGPAPLATGPTGNQAPAGGTVIFIASDIVGRGENRALGGLLMQSFLNTLGAFNRKPESLLFMNDGVRLVCQGSAVIGELKQLEEHGVELLACGTCLSRLGLTSKVAVGRISNMYDIASTMMRAAKVISI